MACSPICRKPWLAVVKAITRASWPSAPKVALKGPCQGSASPKGCPHAHGGYNLGTGCDNSTIWTWGMFVTVTRIIGCEGPSGSHLNMAVCRLRPRGVTLLGDAQPWSKALQRALFRTPAIFGYPACSFLAAVKHVPHELEVQTRDICPLLALKARSLRSRCGQGHAPSEAPEEDPPCLFQLLVAPGVLGLWLHPSHL